MRFLALAGVVSACIALLVFVPNASAQFASPPPYTKRISPTTLLVAPGAWKHVKDKVCPGRDNIVNNVTTRRDGSRVVLCDENTFFSPEIPSVSGKEAPYQTITKYITRKIPTNKVVTRIRTAPVVAMTVLYLIIGVISGAILGSVGTLLVKLRS